MTELVLGPILRYVDRHAATIWVETSGPCSVRVLDQSAPTWSVHGHHYCLLVLQDLPPATATPYQVHLDDRLVWPVPDSTMPPSVIRTFAPDTELRLSFGSCRRSAGNDPGDLKQFGADALVALARQMRLTPHERWPDALFLGGDQVYADLPSPEQKARLKAQHEAAGRAGAHHRELDEVAEEIQNFEEYTWLYHDSWGRDDVRWLLSTVPTVMLLDDHDLRDDWNTSAAWRAEMSAKPWWRERVVGAFGSYWVYQHLGNLSPSELAHDELFSRLRAIDDEAERDRLLDDFAWRADTDPDSVRWSIRRELGSDELSIRLVAVDSRCSRRLDPGERRMLDDSELEWFRAAVADGHVDHLLIGTTLPMLMVPGIHHLEGWNEALAEGRYGPLVAKWSERLRQAVDLEHWAAFRRTFHQVMDALSALGRRDDPPSSILVLSGDMHCSYIAGARLPGIDPRRTSFHQLTMSPFRNPLEPPIRFANKVLSSMPVRKGLRWLADRAGVERVPVNWEIDHGLWFDNGVMTVVLRGREATVEVDHAHVRGEEQSLGRTATVRLTA